MILHIYILIFTVDKRIRFGPGYPKGFKVKD